jgi:hypothetical protein
METRRHSWPTTLFAAAAVVAALAASAASGTGNGERDESASCCVANPRFAGICKVELGPEESCADVLAYLNNAASTGRTYCGGTPIRMGWKQVECQEEE